MSSARTLILIAVLVTSLALGGCLQSEDADQTRAEELRAGAVDAMSEVDSYTMRMTANTSGTGSIPASQQEVVMRIDQADRRLSMEQTISQAGIVQMSQVYLVDDTMYVRQQGAWQSQQLPQDPWEGVGAQQAQQLQALEQSDVTHARNETVDGVETEVLEVEMSGEEYEQLLREQANVSGSGSTVSALLDVVDVESVTIHQYVAAEEPHYVHRIESEVTMSVQGQEITTSTLVTLDDFAENVTVDVPEDLPQN